MTHEVIVVSVRPYALTSRTPGSSSSAVRQSSALTASPPTITSRMGSSAPASTEDRNWRQYAGVRSMTVTSWSRNRSVSSLGAHAWSGSTSVAPPSSVTVICSMEVSKETDANCSTRSSGVMPYRSTSSRHRYESEWCSTRTPFGVPVEPEV